jgi:hypothetical protein
MRPDQADFIGNTVWRTRVPDFRPTDLSLDLVDREHLKDGEADRERGELATTSLPSDAGNGASDGA